MDRREMLLGTGLFGLAAPALLARAEVRNDQPAPPQAAPAQRPPPLLSERIAGAGRDLRAIMQYAVLPPGSGSTAMDALPNHRHAGHLLVYVLDGEVLSSLDAGPAVRYRAGEAWFERPGQLHRILNPSGESRARLLVVILEAAEEEIQ